MVYTFVYALHLRTTPELRATRNRKLFQNGRSQAVRLPKEFRFEGKEFRIRRTRTGVLLEPVDSTVADREKKLREVDAQFAKLDSYNAGEVFAEAQSAPRCRYGTGLNEVAARYQCLCTPGRR